MTRKHTHKLVAQDHAQAALDVAKLVLLVVLAFTVAFLSGCSQGDGTTGPTPIPTVTPAEPLTDVWVTGDAAGLDEALAQLGAALPELRIHRGAGPRQITVVQDAAAVRAHDPGWEAMAEPHACRCTGEGRLTVVDAGATHRALMLHELLHLFGLVHTDRPGSIMGPSVRRDGTMDVEDVARARAAILADADAAARY